MRFPFALLGGLAASQLPLQNPNSPESTTHLGLDSSLPVSSNFASAHYNHKQKIMPADDFAFKEGEDIFAPKDLIQLGRPGAAVANPTGDLAIVPFSQYSLKDSKNNKSIYVVSLKEDGKSLHIPLEKGGDTFWVGPTSIAHVVEKDDHSEIYTYDVSLDQPSPDPPSPEPDVPLTPTLIGTLPTKTGGNFKFIPSTNTLVFSAYVYPDGNLTTVAEQDKAWENRGNTALVYDTTYVRHWDVWQEKKGPQLFSVKLEKDAGGKLGFAQVISSPLQGTGHYSPVEPFGGEDDFDVSETHIVYTTKDPKLDQAWHTKQNVYIVPIAGGQEPKELTSGKQGAVHSVVFNTKGNKAAWLELDKDGYESDRHKIVIYDLEKDVRFTVTQDWDRSPSALAFSKDDTFLYFTGGDHAKVKVFALPVPPTPSHSTTHPKLSRKHSTPVALTHSKAASGLQTLPDGSLLFSQSSFTHPNDAFVIRAEALRTLEHAIINGGDDLQEAEKVGKHIKLDRITNFSGSDLKGKNLSEGEEFWFKGAKDKRVQGWALKPRGWKEGDKKKWPAVLLIHGGPQSAWEDQWSTRWNPNMFTQQGYFVIMINPTGSTTFGQEFTDDIAEDWGGKPFVDMIHGWKHALHQYPEIDADRAVAAGASWGGYAINWIQGHPEYGFNFKALVCHDGVFDSNYNGYSTDELFFFNHEWGGRPWEEKSKKLSTKFSPSNFVHKWSTPQLLIHGSKDYRLPETESIGAFHALQQLGIPSRLVIFPDENHWVLNHGNSLKWHYEVFRWFDKFVGEKS
ncbi:hypothetical protein CVT24_004378 [Panaeolus cyanescens]|uniref:Dipeptidyl-peptidase V n=1 Tax=Panaeolus cyanescens TaxID=181874 RepID=A0A409VD97_9AGAR|nr:hypothetical protein CVT24_004378 [Panaeolus cyanescens]